MLIKVESRKSKVESGNSLRLLPQDKIELLSSIFPMNNYIPIDERTKTFAIRIIKACAYLNKVDDTSKVKKKL
jgi:hypothetical protein